MGVLQQITTMFMTMEYPSVCTLLFLVTILVCILVYVLLMFRKVKCPGKIPKSGVLGLQHASSQKLNQYLCNFIIKASYSSCSVGDFKNDYVDVCALKNVIQQGCRVLDFEIYSLKGDPIVAVSTKSSHNEKGSYNGLPLETVLNYIFEKAISKYDSSTVHCPNPRDPLILNFRMKTSILDIYNKMAALISTVFSNYLLSNEYSLTNNPQSSKNYENNIWTKLKLSDVRGKVIIMVNSTDSNLASSRLYEIVNVISNGMYMNLIRSNDVNYTMENGKDASNEYYTSSNYNKVTMVLPSIHYRPVNYTATKCFNLGIQICSMCFQLNNKALQSYNKVFEDEKSAFVLKNKMNEKVSLYASTDTSGNYLPPANPVTIQTSTEMGRFMPSISLNF
jgi:hypothetical protein